TITARYDRAAVRHEALFAQCLLEGFDEILALAGKPAPRAVPASFTAEPSDSSTRSVAASRPAPATIQSEAMGRSGAS
ncbi:MAG: hypothetical protein JO106_02520, partial [Mycobacterium sp.]|nr:hypothetical protein [Mycobacterium sp.]